VDRGEVSILAVTTLEALGATDVRAVMVSYRDALQDHREAINRLNVYPVPDGDTGTNMALTVDSTVVAIDRAVRGTGDGGEASDGGERSAENNPAPVEPGRSDMDLVCEAIAHGSLMGARGNSGVILSQLLRGLADGFGDAARQGADGDGARDPSGRAVGAAELARALAAADRLAREAVMRPVEGTILTVARGAAGAATEAAEAGGSLVEVVEAARAGAADALARTPELLSVLADAGVVDAGGTGYLLLFDALSHVVAGNPLPEPPSVERDGPVAASATGSGQPVNEAGEAGAESATALANLRYEVMYLLDAPDETIPHFKEVWAGVGDSIVVVGGGGLWNCHIHTDDIGAAIEAAIDAGRPHSIRVTDLLEQVEEERWVREGAGTAGTGPPETPPGPRRTTGAVAVAAGEGIGRIFRSLGVQRVIAGGQSMNPSTAEMLDAVEAVDADEVVVLPNNDNIHAVAGRVDALTSKKVRIIPTATIVEGFAALLAYDPAAHVDTNAVAMEASAARVVPGEVTRAVRDADGPRGPIRTGDWLGISRGEIQVVSSSPSDAGCRLLDLLVEPGHDLVTIFEGEGSSAADTRRLTEWLHEHWPDVDIEVHHGGQPLYPYLFSIE